MAEYPESFHAYLAHDVCQTVMVPSLDLGAVDEDNHPIMFMLRNEEQAKEHLLILEKMVRSKRADLYHCQERESYQAANASVPVAQDKLLATLGGYTQASEESLATVERRYHEDFRVLRQRWPNLQKFD